MDTLQNDVQSYLESAGLNLLDKRDGFVVADELRLGGAHDTRLVWIAPPSSKIPDFFQFERRLLREFESLIPQYPNANCFLIAHTREGFSRDFRSELSRLKVNLRVPIQFFDTPFKEEEAPTATVGAVRKLLRTAEGHRAPQPYSTLGKDDSAGRGSDLLPHILNSLRNPETSCLHIVVGPAGIGKSVMFRELFGALYRQFIENKKKGEVFPRPVPLVPEHLRGKKASGLRMDDLLENFIRTELVANVPRATFEWMLINSYATWLFDGLDELYVGDDEFFMELLDLLTRQASKTQVLICARESLLTGANALVEFLHDFPLEEESGVTVYRLENWEQPSKRVFACVRLEARPPIRGQADPPKVSQFLADVNRSEALKSLSGLPFYCELLMDQFKQGVLADFADDIALIEHVVSEMIKREEAKGLLSPLQYLPHGLNEWLETVAWEFYDTGFSGLKKAAIEEYAELVLRPELSIEERRQIVITMLQFPLFAPGLEAGALTFEHELVAEYLAGRYFLNLIPTKPSWVATSLGERIDFARSLIARYLAKHLPNKPEGLRVLTRTLTNEGLPRRAFANLLQLLMLANPARDVLKSHKLAFDRRDLSYVEFWQRDLSGMTFRNCNLSQSLFRGCDLQETRFEGAQFVGTRFEEVTEGSLRGAFFGNLEHFEYIYAGKQRIDDLEKAVQWIETVTGRPEEILRPCGTSLQLKSLFLKFVHPDGKGRRDDLPASALSRGKRHAGAPTPEECLSACLRFEYFQGPDFRDRIKRAPGDQYNDMVLFVKDSVITPNMRLILNSLCPKAGCEHLPGSL